MLDASSHKPRKRAVTGGVHLIVYAIVDLLQGQDEILIDKGLSPTLKRALTLTRTVPLKIGEKQVHIPIEGDLAIFSRSNPMNAIVISAKTRLKEIFHIGTMWKLLFDTLGDEHCLKKWDLDRPTSDPVGEILYVFATADMVNDRAAVMYTLICTAKLNDIDPQAWLADVLKTIAEHPAQRLDELLPWNWKAEKLKNAA